MDKFCKFFHRGRLGMLHKSLIRIIVVLILMSGVMPLQAQDKSTKSSSTKTVRKKKPTQDSSDKSQTAKRPTATRKKPSTSANRQSATRKTSTANQSRTKTATSSKKKPASTTSSRSSASKKRPTASKSTASDPKRRTSTSRKQPARRTKAAVSRPPVPKVNTVKMADDIYSLTDELTTSSRQMQQALSYLQPITKRPAVRLESKATVSLAELERQADQKQDDLKIQRQLAKEYEHQQNYDAAMDIYLRMVYSQPHNPNSHYYLGSYYNSINSPQKARQAFEEALLIDPNHSATIAAMANYPDRRKTPMVEEIKPLSMDQPASQMNAIKRELDAGNLNASLILIGKAQTEFPDQVGFVYLEGVVYTRQGQVEKAKTAYLRATRVDPDHQDTHQALADMYFEQGVYLYAALSCAQVVRLDPLNISFRFRQGMSFFLAGEWGRAISAWEDLLHYAPRNSDVKQYLPQAYYILATEYNRRGQSSLGRESFNRALSVNNNAHSWLPGALTVLGKYYREQGFFKESLTALQEVIELQPKAAEAYTEIGITYWKMDEHRLARAAWQRSLELQPANNAAQGWLILSRQSG